MWNVFIIEETHLREITRHSSEEGDTIINLLHYRMPMKFLMMMNLVVVTDRVAGTMTIVKNRWIDDNPWTQPGTHEYGYLKHLLKYVQEQEEKYSV